MISILLWNTHSARTKSLTNLHAWNNLKWFRKPLAAESHTIPLFLKTDVVSSSETSVNAYKITCHDNPEHYNPYLHFYEKLYVRNITVSLANTRSVLTLRACPLLQKEERHSLLRFEILNGVECRKGCLLSCDHPDDKGSKLLWEVGQYLGPRSHKNVIFEIILFKHSTW
jgi:hypothetical protein